MKSKADSPSGRISRMYGSFCSSNAILKRFVSPGLSSMAINLWGLLEALFRFLLFAANRPTIALRPTKSDAAVSLRFPHEGLWLQLYREQEQGRLRQCDFSY